MPSRKCVVTQRVQILAAHRHPKVNKQAQVGGKESFLYFRCQQAAGGEADVILIVLGTVNLLFQGPFIPIFLWSILRIVAACVLGTVWSPCS